MNKFSKEYYRQYRFNSEKFYNIPKLLSFEYDEEMVDYHKNEFFKKYPEQKIETLKIFEDELAKVNAYKEALEEGIELFKKHYL